MVDDLATAIEFFVELGLSREARSRAAGRNASSRWTRALEFTMMRTPDGHGEIELTGPVRRPRASQAIR